MSNVRFSPSLPSGLGHTGATPVSFLNALERLGTHVSLEPGTDLFQQGDEADAIFVLNEGSLEVSILSEDGHKLTLNLLNKGTIFGEIALVDGGPRSATVTAADRCSLLRVGRKEFLNEIRSNPDFAVDMIRVCVDRLRWVSGQLEDHVFHPLPVRLARRLLYLMDTRAQGSDLPMSQSTLAAHVGVSREAVAKVLSEWKHAGIVALGRGRISVRDVDALQDYAAAGEI